jgi:hypothetical protein
VPNDQRGRAKARWLRESQGEQRRKTLSYTARPITSLGGRFLPFGSASSRTSLCGFMLLSGDNSRRAQPILSLSPPRRLRPSVRASRERIRPWRVKECCRQHPCGGAGSPASFHTGSPCRFSCCAVWRMWGADTGFACCTLYPRACGLLPPQIFEAPSLMTTHNPRDGSAFSLVLYWLHVVACA